MTEPLDHGIVNLPLDKRGARPVDDTTVETVALTIHDSLCGCDRYSGDDDGCIFVDGESDNAARAVLAALTEPGAGE